MSKVPKPQSEQDKEGQRPRPVSRLNCVTLQELPTDSFPSLFLKKEIPGKFPPTEGIPPNGPMSFPSGFSEPACVGLAELIYLGLIKWQATLNLANFFQRASTWSRTSGMLYPEEAPLTSSLPQSSPTLISPCNHPLP